MGTIKTANDDARRSINSRKVNFFATYDMDPSNADPTAHVLEAKDYATTNDANHESWLLLEAELAVREEGEDAMETH